MSKNLNRYRELTDQWRVIRDDPDISEDDKDTHLELMDDVWWTLTEDEVELIEKEAKSVIEVAMVFNEQGQVLTFHAPPGRTGGSIPDSRDLWEVMWEARDDLGGVAHTHPWEGPAIPSQMDVTTWAACEAGLGKRLLWPIVTFTEVGFFCINEVTGRYVPAGPITFTLQGVDELRRLSRT